MSKTPFEESHHSDELLTEYQFDYQKAKPNRFATLGGKQLLKVAVLDKNVAQVFTTPEAVNKAIRALMESMPQDITPSRPSNSDADVL